MARLTVADINQYSCSTINPLDNPDEIFELYSVPSFDMQYPEIVKGSNIGSSKITFVWGEGLLRAYKLESKIANNPRIVIDPSIEGQYVNGVKLWRKDA